MQSIPGVSALNARYSPAGTPCQEAMLSCPYGNQWSRYSFYSSYSGGARAKERGYRYIPGGEELEPPFKERRGK